MPVLNIEIHVNDFSLLKLVFLSCLLFYAKAYKSQKMEYSYTKNKHMRTV